MQLVIELAMLLGTITILWCAARLWGNQPNSFLRMWPFDGEPALRRIVLVLFFVIVLVQFYTLNGLLYNIVHNMIIAGNLLALAVVEWPQRRKAIAFVVVVASWLALLVHPSLVTADVMAVVFIVLVLNLAMQMSRSFIGWSLFGLANVVYDFYNNYIVDTMTDSSNTAVATASPTVIVISDILGSDGAVIGVLDVAIPGTIVMVAAITAHYTNRKSVLYGGLVGYAVGFMIVILVANIAHNGVAAMIPLFPCTALGVILTAWRAGILSILMKLAREHPQAMPG